MEEFLDTNALITAYRSMLSSHGLEGMHVYENMLKEFDKDQLTKIVNNLVAMNIALADLLSSITETNPNTLWESFCALTITSEIESEEENDN